MIHDDSFVQSVQQVAMHANKAGVSVRDFAKAMNSFATRRFRVYLAVAALVLILQIAVAFWWLPQKWQACQKLYSTRPSQIFCLLNK